MPTKMDELIARMGFDGPQSVNAYTAKLAVKYSFLRIAYTLVTAALPDRVDRSESGDIILGWSNKFEMRIQPDFLVSKQPHKHHGTDVVEFSLSGAEIFGMVFEAVNDAIFEDIPTVDEDGKTSGPTVFFTDGVYLKLTHPGLPDGE